TATQLTCLFAPRQELPHATAESPHPRCCLKVAHARVDVDTGQLSKPVEAEGFNRETGCDRSPSHRRLQRSESGEAERCDVAEHSACEAVACAGGIDDLVRFGRESRHRRHAIAMHQHCAVFSLLVDCYSLPHLYILAQGHSCDSDLSTMLIYVTT